MWRRRGGVWRSRSPAQVYQLRSADGTAAVMEPSSVSQGVRSMFFMLTPNESSYEKVEDVPQYVQQVSQSPGRVTCRHLSQVQVHRRKPHVTDPHGYSQTEQNKTTEKTTTMQYTKLQLCNVIYTPTVRTKYKSVRYEN